MNVGQVGAGRPCCAVREECGDGGGGDHRAEVDEGAQQPGGGAHARRVGLVVQGVLVGEVVQALRDAGDDADDGQDSQTALPGRRAAAAAQPTICDEAPTTSLPRTCRRRPVSVETTTAASDIGSSTSPADGRAAARGPPPATACSRRGRRRTRRTRAAARVGGQQRDVAAEHAQVDERLGDAQLARPRSRPPRRRASTSRYQRGEPRVHQEQQQRDRASRRTARCRRGRSLPAGAARGERRRGRRSAPRTRQATASGTLTVKIVRQPPRPISSPPSVGPMTAMVWVGDRERGQDAGRAVVAGALGLAADQVHRGRVAGAGAEARAAPGRRRARRGSGPARRAARRRRPARCRAGRAGAARRGRPAARRPAGRPRSPGRAPETSHAVCDGGAPNAAPIGTSATAIIDELIGLSTEPSIIGAISRRSKLGRTAGTAVAGRRSVIAVTAGSAGPAGPAPR